MRDSRRQRTKLTLNTIFIACGSLLALQIETGAARADVTDELLAQLKAKGILTNSEYKTFKERHAKEVAAKPLSGPIVGMRKVTKDGVVIVPDDRYVTRMDKGIGVHIGNVDVQVSGLLSFFGVETFRTHGNAIVAGGLSGNSAANNIFSIRPGLVPSEIATTISTNQEGYDLSFKTGFFIGGNNVGAGPFNANNAGSPVALGSSGIDVRQVFGTIGKPDFGTVKIGRDMGLFGAEAVLEDATIPGSGTPSGNRAPGQSTLGHIGYGYFYVDWIPQLTYTTPDYHGFTASIGLFTPLDEYNYSGLSGGMSGHDQPAVQWQFKYVGQLGENAKLTAWTAGVTQQHRAEIGDSVVLNGSMGPGTSIRAFGIDGGAKLDVGPVSLLAYGYYGDGMGSTFLFFDGIDPFGRKRESYGGYAQATYAFNERFLIGGAYGISVLDATSTDPGTLVRSNENFIGLARYKLTNWVTFQGEFIHSISRNQAGGYISGDAIAVGTFWTF